MGHEILLRKLKICGITGKLFSWIEKFITNRHQFFNIKGFHSVLALVISGVPQGSVLGPILFLIYINDLKKCLKSSSASSFADDTRLSQQITCCEDTSHLQDDLFSLVKWAEQNNMELHENKLELLTYLPIEHPGASYSKNFPSLQNGLNTTLLQARLYFHPNLSKT